MWYYSTVRQQKAPKRWGAGNNLNSLIFQLQTAGDPSPDHVAWYPVVTQSLPFHMNSVISPEPQVRLTRMIHIRSSVVPMSAFAGRDIH